jgi:hypothetical protein
MATIYMDSRYQPRHPVRSAALIVVLALVTFLVAIALLAKVGG